MNSQQVAPNAEQMVQILNDLAETGMTPRLGSDVERKECRRLILRVAEALAKHGLRTVDNTLSMCKLGEVRGKHIDEVKDALDRAERPLPVSIIFRITPGEKFPVTAVNTGGMPVMGMLGIAQAS